jgi:hypothetical protein
MMLFVGCEFCLGEVESASVGDKARTVGGFVKEGEGGRRPG